MKLSITTIALAVTLACNVLTAFAQDSKSKEEKKLDGKTIFLDKKCSGCHSIEAAGITKKTSSSSKTGPPDLSDEGSKHDSTFLVNWLQKKETLHGKKHLLKFAGSDEELKALVQWLATLKSDTAKKSKP